MRIRPEQLRGITQSFQTCFGAGARLVLFGSRVDEARHGGDIDFCVETDPQPWDALVRARCLFLAALWKVLGERKIDVVLRRRGDAPRLIDQEVDRTGVELCRNPS